MPESEHQAGRGELLRAALEPATVRLPFAYVGVFGGTGWAVVAHGV